MQSTFNPFKIVNPPASDWVTNIISSKILLVFISLVLLTLVFSFFRDLIQKVFQSLIFQNFYASLLKEIRSAGFLLLIPLILIGIYNCSLFIWLSLDYSIIQSLYFLTAFLIFKIFFIQMVGVIFPIKTPTQNYSTSILIFFIALGIGMTPINLLLAFSNIPKIYLLNLGLLFVFLIVASGALRSFTINMNWILKNKFHFLLYICTVEFAPFLVMYKIYLV